MKYTKKELRKRIIELMYFFINLSLYYILFLSIFIGFFLSTIYDIEAQTHKDYITTKNYDYCHFFNFNEKNINNSYKIRIINDTNAYLFESEDDYND